MRTTKVTSSLIALIVGLGLALTLVIGAYAQGPDREVGEEEVQPQGIGGLGLADPPPAGFSVLYMFTGVGNDNTGSDQMATTVHCTNFGSTATTLELQFFLRTGGTGLSSPYTDTLSSNETTTYSTQPTLFTESLLNAAIMEQGSGRVLVKEHSQVICSAHLLQPGSITPTFMVKLPIFDSSGNFVDRASPLTLRKQGPATVLAGRPITYTLTLTNNGPTLVTNLVITDKIPAGATYVSGGTKLGNVVSWTVPSLAANGGVTQVILVVTATQTIINSHYGAQAAGGYSVQGNLALTTQIYGRLYLPLLVKP